MEVNSENCYSITKNDLKYKKMRNLDGTKINTFDSKNTSEYNKELQNLYLNENLDSFEYRINECNKENNKILDLKHLDLKIFPKLADDIINNLEELYISNNDIEELPDLHNFKKLKVIDISVNKLKKIGKLPNTLIEFCCFDNLLLDISPIKNCINLKTLYICNNKISDLSFLESNKSLEILLANDNQITDIPRNIPKLKKIQIKNNKLTKVKSYDNLIYLDCRNNNILEVEQQINLRDLIISNNKELSDLPVMNKLKYLEIVNTKIERIRYMEKLEELILLLDNLKYISKKYRVEDSYCHKNKYVNLFFIPKEN